MAWTTPTPFGAFGPPPQLHAAPIGEVASAIMRQRELQQANMQKQFSDLAKTIEQQRQDKAYTEALRNAGLTQGQDISGLSGTDATRLAQLVQAQTPDTALDALRKAQANYYNQRPPTGALTENERFNQLKTQAGILGQQAGDIEEEQAGYGLKPDVAPAAHGYVMRDGKLDYARTPEEQANPTLVSPNDPLKDPNAPTFTPDVYKQRQAQSVARQNLLKQQQDVQSKMLTPPAGGAAGGGAPGGQYPVGTRARRGSTWYTKQEDGSWLPDQGSTDSGSAGE